MKEITYKHRDGQTVTTGGPVLGYEKSKLWRRAEGDIDPWAETAQVVEVPTDGDGTPVAPQVEVPLTPSAAAAETQPTGAPAGELQPQTTVPPPTADGAQVPASTPTDEVPADQAPAAPTAGKLAPPAGRRGGQAQGVPPTS